MADFKSDKPRLVLPEKRELPKEAPKTHVRMKRNPEQYKQGPHSANVHVDEVDNWSKHGWEVDGAN